MRQFYKDWLALPAKFKLTMLVMLLLTIWVLSAAFVGYTYVPGDPYIVRQYERINHHMPIYVALIKAADRATLEKCYGRTLPADTDWFKKSMEMELAAWKLLIVEQYNIFKKSGG